jgi:hypothetical protein
MERRTTAPGPRELGVELPASLRQDVERYAERHGVRLSEALRYLVEAGLAAEAAAMLEGGSSGDHAP